MKITQYIWIFAIVSLFCLLTVHKGSAQNVGISSSSTFVPDASAALDVSYTSKGLLIPRVALTANNAAGPITSPATSLLVYNTATAGTSPNNVIPGYYYWNGTIWVMLSTSTQTAGTWSTTGNAGTSYPTNYFGTTDNFGVHFKTNATHRLWLDSLGSVAVGTNPIFSSVREKFLVDAGTTTSNNVISGKGNLNSYLQLNLQNTNAGTAASSDVVATADNGNESVNYVDMGINSSANTANSFGGINDAYLYNAGGTASGGNFYIGTSTANKSLGFLIGGNLVAAGTTMNNERMRIDGATGNVGIGTISPATKLHVFGANPLTLSGVANGTNTTADSLLTITNGLVRKLPMSTFTSTTNAWSTTGNAGTTAGTNFIGTTDAIDFVAKTNNAERLRISSIGDVLIGGTTFNSTNPEQLLVDAGSTSTTPTTSFNVISGKGYIDKYLQLNIQNMSPTAAASSDVVASNDAATETAGFIDMGINSSGNTSTGVLGGASTAYLLATGNDFVIGNGTASKNLTFFTSGTTSTATNAERMRIDASGNVGIGTTAPTQKLDVTGSIRASNSVMAQASVYVDAATSNTGAVTPGLVFGGTNSGEGIASQRSGGNLNGIDFYTNFINRMAVTNAGNIGINTKAPTSTLAVNGSITVAVVIQTGSYTLTATDYMVINTGGASTYTLPAANTCAGRIYRILNHGTANVTISPAVYTTSTATGSSLSNSVGTNVLEIISDGTNWQRINQ